MEEEDIGLRAAKQKAVSFYLRQLVFGSRVNSVVQAPERDDEAQAQVDFNHAMTTPPESGSD
jgi:hypothetical protein